MGEGEGRYGREVSAQSAGMLLIPSQQLDHQRMLPSARLCDTLQLARPPAVSRTLVSASPPLQPPRHIVCSDRCSHGVRCLRFLQRCCCCRHPLHQVCISLLFLPLSLCLSPPRFCLVIALPTIFASSMPTSATICTSMIPHTMDESEDDLICLWHTAHY